VSLMAWIGFSRVCAERRTQRGSHTFSEAQGGRFFPSSAPRGSQRRSREIPPQSKNSPRVGEGSRIHGEAGEIVRGLPRVVAAATFDQQAVPLPTRPCWDRSGLPNAAREPAS
jgi:hypothetical protein